MVLILFTKESFKTINLMDTHLRRDGIKMYLGVKENYCLIMSKIL